MQGSVNDVGRMIYVVTTEDGFPCKVGITADLTLRITSLQCGNWNRLRPVWYSFVVVKGAKDTNLWSAFTTAPNVLESAVHRNLKELDLHLSGEWFAVTSDDCVKVIEKVANDNGLRLAGIEMLSGIAMYDRLPNRQVAFLSSFVEAEKSARQAMAITGQGVDRSE